MLSLLAAIAFGLHLPGAVAQEISPRGDAPTSASARAMSDALSGYQFQFAAMGTQVELQAFHADRQQVAAAFQQAQQRVTELAAILTDYDPHSETRQLTPRAVDAFVPVSDPLWQMLVASQRWHELSNGAFDASLGQLTQLWRKYRRSTRLPTPEEIALAREHTGWQHVQLDNQQQRVRLGDPQLRLDFGAIGKGFVVDQAFDLLQQHGLDRVLVNISGNMRVGLPPPERSGWRIEIAPLEPGGQPLRRIELCQAAIATSGDLWQYVTIDGVRHSHVLDPRTGLGVVGPLCATVISPLATDADALATTACVAGFAAAQKIAQQLGATHVLVARRVADSSPSTTARSARENNSSAASPGPIHLDETPGFPASLAE